jgi:hypothetical protein
MSMVFIGIPDTPQCSSRQSKRVSFFPGARITRSSRLICHVSSGGRVRITVWARIALSIWSDECNSECFRDVWNCKAVRAKQLGTREEQFTGIAHPAAGQGWPNAVSTGWESLSVVWHPASSNLSGAFAKLRKATGLSACLSAHTE